MKLRFLLSLILLVCFVSKTEAQQCDTADVIADPCLVCDIVLEKTPCFSTLDTIGCIPHTVNIIDCSNACIPRYFFEGGIPTRNPSHVYRNIGIYDVTQQFGTDELKTLTKRKFIRAVSDYLPRFKVNYCKDKKVVFTFDADNLYDRFIINYGDGSPIDTVNKSDTPLHTYSDTSGKTTSIQGIYNHAPCTNTAFATVKPKEALVLPSIKKLQTQTVDNINGEIAIQFNGVSYFGFILHHTQGTSLFSVVDTFFISGADTTVRVSGIDTKNHNHCFYFSTVDYCGNTLNSDTICSVSLFAEAINNQNNIIWLAYPRNDFTGYQLFKNQDSLLFNTTQTTLNDTHVVCANNYCYTIKINTSTSPTTDLVSNEVCVESISTDTPLPITDFQSSFIDSLQIELTWQSPLPYKVFKTVLKQSENGFSFSNLGSTDDFDSNFIYTKIIESPICYTVDYTDACGNNSDNTLADTTCVMHLRAEKLQDLEYQLTWSPYKGFDTLIYTLQYLDEKGQVAQEKTLGSSTNFTDNTPLENFQNLRYRVRALSSDGRSSYSNIVAFVLKSRIFIPTAFSPDGDNINDFFKPDTRFIKNYSLSVFNRWGELLYKEEDSQNGWDGTYKGKKVSTGTYVYILEGTDFFDNKIEKKGTVTVYY